VDPVFEAARASGLLERGEAVLVMSSGGRDSVCLLDVAARLCGPGAVSALHVNYGLRGEESDGDERHVRALCERLGVALEVVHTPPPPEHGNLQAWARDLRYAAALGLARPRGARIAAGHTASDQAETVLYRLAASPGRRALLGMRERDGLLIRPLLGVTREETADYCRARGLDWREDSTNASTRFARGRVRGDLLPALQAIHPAAEQNVLRTAALLRDEAAVLDEVLRTALAGRDRITLERLAELPAALGRLALARLAEDAAGELVPGAAGRLDALLRLAPAGGSASLDIGGGVRAVVEYGVLRMERAEPGSAAAPVALSVPGSARLGAWRLDCELGPGGPGELARLAPDGSVGLLDADALRGAELTVRPWRAGDRMQPLGLHGTKTLADLFTDRRVPRAERQTLPVVLCGDAVAWVPGVATAEPFRVTDASTRVAVLAAHRD
jgi:tRNA(Ile)-lysidine synthase